MKWFRDLVIEFKLNPHAFFTVGYEFPADDTTPVTWNCTTYGWGK